MSLNEIEKLLENAKSCVQAAQYGEAEKLLKTCISQESGSREAHLLLGITLAMEGKPEDAAAEFAAVTAINPLDPEGLNNTAVVYRRQGRAQEALSFLLDSVDVDPTRGEYYFNIANVQKDMGSLKAAVMSCAKVIEIDPEFAPAYNSLGIIYDQLKEYNKAIGVFKTGISLDPDNPSVRFNYGAALEAAGKLDEALAEYQAALNGRPGWIEPINNIGIIQFLQGNSEEALRTFNSILEIESTNSMARNNIGVIDVTTENTDEAIEYFNDAIEASPGYVQASLNLSKTLADSGDPGAAIAELERCIKLVPDSIEVRNRLALLNLKIEQYPEALEQVTSVLEKSDLDIEALRIKGVVSLKSGNVEEAQASFEKILSVAPEAKNSFNMDLADIHFARKEYKEAESCVTAYLEKKPKDVKAKLLLTAVSELAAGEETDEADFDSIKEMWDKNIELLKGSMKEDAEANAVNFDSAKIKHSVDENAEIFFYKGSRISVDECSKTPADQVPETAQAPEVPVEGDSEISASQFPEIPADEGSDVSASQKQEIFIVADDDDGNILAALDAVIPEPAAPPVAAPSAVEVSDEVLSVAEISEDSGFKIDPLIEEAPAEVELAPVMELPEEVPEVSLEAEPAEPEVTEEEVPEPEPIEEIIFEPDLTEQVESEPEIAEPEPAEAEPAEPEIIETEEETPEPELLELVSDEPLELPDADTALEFTVVPEPGLEEPALSDAEAFTPEEAGSITESLDSIGKDDLLRLLQKLKSMTASLPEKDRLAFLESDKRLRLELLIEALEGRIGLFRKIEEKRREL